MKHKINRKILLVAYIALLVAVLISWRDAETSPPMYQRIIFVVATFISAFINEKAILPIIACFSTVSFYGYAHTFFPAELSFIIPLLFVFALIKKKKKFNFKQGGALFLLLAIYTAFVDLLTSGTIHPVSLSFFAIFIFGVLLDNDNEEFRLFGYALCLSSIILSYEFFHVGEEMVRDYSAIGLSRVFLRDPNYYGAVIAAGVLVAFREQLDNRNKSIYEKVLYIATIALTFVAIVLNGSRGAMLSVSLSCVLLIMLYPTKTKYKIFVLIAVVIGISMMYQNGYFELLQYRIESDSGTGSNRTVIWEAKSSTFFQEGAFYNLFFGYGNEKALTLGVNNAFHNDFIAVLVEYGFVGLVLFISLLLKPIIDSNKNNRAEIAVLVLFLVVTISTIEPITAGRYAHLFIYVYIYKLLLIYKEKPR